LEGWDLYSVDIDSATQRLFFTDYTELCVADLDCTGATTIAHNSLYSPPVLSVQSAFPVDAEDGYVSWVINADRRVHTALADGSDPQSFVVSETTGMPENPIVADVALYVVQGSPVESMSWGRLKSEFR
jgi:hypothetical protein